jgi:glycine/D-amino acid oxidase-like deaminating enzyme
MTGHAIVVGGGIGGLATAVALRRIGWRATVLERAPELGVEAAARAVGVPTCSASNLRRSDGLYLQRAQPGDPTPLLAFHRADLHSVLRDAVPADWLHRKRHHGER